MGHCHHFHGEQVSPDGMEQSLLWLVQWWWSGHYPVAMEAMLVHAKKIGADLIIMPSHKRSKVDKVVLGSVANKVVQNSPVNVLVVKPQG